MKILIHRATRFQKQLQALEKAGGKGQLAAQRAQAVIQDLDGGGQLPEDDSRRMTNHGELRIPKCRKYDLGGGYRLVGVHRGEHLIFCFLGSHDECDRWIENNRGFSKVTGDAPVQRIFSLHSHRQPAPFKNPAPDEEETGLEMDDRTLRMVFRGLCGESGAS